MTLAIGAKYPCGPLFALQTQLPQAIVFVTDSRWTYKNPEHPYEDIGFKLRSITDHSAIVYSGDVATGEHCITELKRKLNRRKPKVINLSNTLTRIYRFHTTGKNPSDHPLLFLFGAYLPSGEANLVYLKSPNFKPLFVEGIIGIGKTKAFEDAKEMVQQQVKTIFNDKIERHSVNLAMLLAGIVHDYAINKPEYPTVGGPLQCAIIGKNGITPLELSWTKDPTGKRDTWHKATPEHGELTTFKEKYNLGLDFKTIKSFRSYSFLD